MPNFRLVGDFVLLRIRVGGVRIYHQSTCIGGGSFDFWEGFAGAGDVGCQKYPGWLQAF